MESEKKELQLDELKVSSLPELQGWKEKQEQLVIDNPFVEIIDNKSYEIACKSRTNLLKGRTSLESQEKTIASKLSNFRKEIGAKTKELIDITEPHEDKQQQEVKRYENIKAQAKAEEERIERERVEKIEKKISDFESDSYKIIQETNIENVELHKTMLDAFVNDEFDYEEYEVMFEQERIRVQNYWDNKCNEIQEKEQQRLENERMKQEGFDVRVARLKEVGYEFIDDVFVHEKLELTFTKEQVYNSLYVLFEHELSDIKKSLDKLEQAKRDAEIKKQKEEQFEVRKNRLAEIGMFLNNEEMFCITGFILTSKELVYNASITEFEEILTDAKKSIKEAKEQKEIADQEAKEVEELALKQKEEADKKLAAEKKKSDAENKARVKRLENDKKVVTESLEVYFADLYLETKNQEITDFINGANNLLQGLKTELLTKLKEL